MAEDAKNICSRGADYFNCRMMPHGGPVLIPIVLTTLGLCAVLADDGCDYARLRGAAVTLLTGSDAVPFVDCGLTAYRVPSFYPAENTWRVVYADACRPYDFRPLLADTSWVAAEWMRFMSLTVGGATALFLWTSMCLTLRPHHWRAAGIGAACACLLQVSSFVWFYTKLCHTTTTDMGDFEAGREVEVSADSAAKATSSCELFFGSNCAVTSCVLWAAAAGVMLLRKYPAPVPKYIVAKEQVAILGGTDAASGLGQSHLTSGRSYATGSFAESRRSQRKMTGSAHKSFQSKGELTMSMRTDMTSLRQSRQSAPWAEGHDRSARSASFRASGRAAANPVSFVRPTELSGSTFSAVSFV